MKILSFILETAPFLLQGLIITLEIAFLSSSIGFILGILLGFLHTITRGLISWIITVYVTIIRGTPLLIQIPFLYYLLPEIGIHLSAFSTAVLAIGLNSSAYMSQIIKVGIKSIPQGQKEAAAVLGLTQFQTMRYIIFPQVIRVIIPALLNEFITLVKDSSLASTIGVVELFKESSRIISYTYNAIPVFCMMGCLYLIITTSLSIALQYIECKLDYHA